MGSWERDLKEDFLNHLTLIYEGINYSKEDEEI